MHEGHLTRTIAGVIRKELREMNAQRLTTVTLRLGEASGVKPESVCLYLAEFLKDLSVKDTDIIFEQTEGAGVEVVSIEAE